MVSAFRGLTELVSMRHGTGIVTDWRQAGGNLLIGGDARVIRLWDAHTESQVLVSSMLVVLELRLICLGQDLDTNSESPVTSIASDHGSSQIFVAGFADGMAKIFDRRLAENNAVVRSYSDHTSWIQNVRWHPMLRGQFFSAR